MREVENRMQFNDCSRCQQSMKAGMERNNRWREMMSMDGDSKFLRCNLVLVKIKTCMLLTGATILMTCAALFCLIVTQGATS